MDVYVDNYTSHLLQPDWSDWSLPNEEDVLVFSSESDSDYSSYDTTPPPPDTLFQILSSDSDSSESSYEPNSPKNTDTNEIEAPFSPKQDPSSKAPNPSCLATTNLIIGSWRIAVADVKFLFGRKRVKYVFSTSASGPRYMIDYDFSQVIGLWINKEDKIVKIEISTAPSFAQKKSGKWARVKDFTGGNATTFRQHLIHFDSPHFEYHWTKFLACDPRLSGLVVHVTSSMDVNSDAKFNNSSICDWDKENMSTIHCEECDSNYCDDCDDVLHRHPAKKAHVRNPIFNDKNNKRKKRSRCRCGTGATRNTLGCPCSGNRCPCYAQNKKCNDCGCKNCSNPYNPKIPQTQ